MAGSSYALSVIVSAVDKISAPLQKIKGALSTTLANIGEKFKALGDKLGVPIVVNALGKVGEAAGDVVKRVAVIGGAFVGVGAAAIAALVPMAQAYADATGAIGDVAERTGVSRERFQELAFAAKMSGSSAEALAGAFKKMNMAIGQAQTGSKDLKEMFAGLNINLKNSNGSLKSTDELFDLFVNRISRIKDPALQSQAAVKIFGESATELLPLLRTGSAGVAEMAAEARRLGIVLSEDAVGSGEELGDTLDTLQLVFTGISQTIMSAIVPSLNKLGKQLTESIVKYRPQIEAFAAAFAEKLPVYIDRTVEAFGSLYDALVPVATAIGFLFDIFGTGPTIVGALGAVITGFLLPPIITLTGAIYSLGAALLATPIGWFIAAVAAIAAAAYLVYKNWEPIKKFFADLWGSVVAAFDGFKSFVSEWNPGEILGRKLRSALDELGQSLPDWAKKLFGIDAASFNISANVTGPNQAATAVPEGAGVAAAAGASGKVTVDFKNLPQGAEVEAPRGAGVKVQTNQGYSMMGS